MWKIWFVHISRQFFHIGIIILPYLCIGFQPYRITAKRVYMVKYKYKLMMDTRSVSYPRKMAILLATFERDCRMNDCVDGYASFTIECTQATWSNVMALFKVVEGLV